MKNFISLFRANPIVFIAILAACITCFFVPPDAQYAGYFDLSTLSCLFCTLAVISALKNIAFFRTVAQKIVTTFHSIRSAITALIFITYIGSMIIANDMALLTFLPLGFFVLESTGNRKYMAFTFTMQTLAANLGGMLTPFGNPQNLYLYSHFGFTDADFFSTMLFPFLLSLVLIVICCIFIKNKPLTLECHQDYGMSKKRAIVYISLFVLCIAAVFKIIPYWSALLIVVATLLIVDRKALLLVDYPLLLTFCAFFVFSGNLSRIESIRSFVEGLAGNNTLLLSTLSCQVISNVPTAVLLSRFSVDIHQLLVGVNIGGAGTLIASLASLITFREYNKHDHKHIKRYILIFSGFNFGFLAILYIACRLMFLG